MPEEMHDSFQYSIDGRMVSRTYIRGEIIEHVGPSNRLSVLDGDRNLLENCSFDDKGFHVAGFLDKQAFNRLRKEIINYIYHLLPSSKKSASLSVEILNMEQSIFHRFIEDLYTGIEADAIHFPMRYLEEMLSKITGKRLHFEDFGLFRGPLVRIIRPGKPDYNPPHRDIYIDRLRNRLNLFIPIYGCSRKSSLPLIPGSHYWRESDTLRTSTKCLIDGIRFNVPAIISKNDGTPLAMTRPAVEEGKILLFSPYIIHGGAKNYSSDIRISLELRFSESLSI